MADARPDRNIERGDDGAKRRIGLLVLETDQVTERDFRRALTGHAVEYHTARVPNVNPVTLESLRSMGPRLARSAASILPGMGLDAIAYSCTAATVAIGFDAVRDQIHDGRPDIPVATPATGAVKALQHAGHRRIALLVPNIAAVGVEVTQFFRKNGIEVLSEHYLGIESDVDMAYLTPGAIVDAVRRADHPEAEAFFVSCTAIRSMEVLDELEAALGKPCYSANQCMLWDALRLSGYSEPVSGNGSLLNAPR